MEGTDWTDLRGTWQTVVISQSDGRRTRFSANKLSDVDHADI